MEAGLHHLTRHAPFAENLGRPSRYESALVQGTDDVLRELQPPQPGLQAIGEPEPTPLPFRQTKALQMG